LEDDCLGINEFESYSKAYMAVLDFMDFYNHIRIHSATEYLPPQEYYSAVADGSIKPTVVRV